MRGMKPVTTIAAGIAAAILLAHAALAQETLRSGQDVRGALAQGDEVRESGAFSDAYVIEGQAGQSVEIQLSSDDVDPYLVLEGPDGFRVVNDDDFGSGTLNSRIETTLPASGQYVVLASSFGAGSTGAYTLRMSTSEAVVQSPSNARSRRLTLGRAVAGELETSDAQLSSGEYADVYSFEGTAGQQVAFALQSSAFDAYLIVGGPNGFQQDNDDDPNSDTLNSRIVVTLPASGTYQVQATSYAAGATGQYSISVTQTAESAARAADLEGGRGAPLVSGQVATGALQAGDGTLESGEYVDSYRFLGQRGQRVVINMESDVFDTYVMLRSPSGEQEDNDDGPNSTNSQLETVLSEDGEYGVHATSYQPGETGSYRISVTTSGGAGDRVVADGNDTIGASGARLSVNRTAQGRLEADDESLESGEFFDTFTFNGRAGQNVAFELNSTEIDPYLIVVSPSGEQQENDDADFDAGVRDSRLAWQLPETGEYQVIATSYGAAEIGAYNLRVTTGGTASSTPSVRPPVTGGRGRVYAVMVGISDYSGLANSLRYTAEDAINLSTTLRREGVLAPESVVLTDNQATRAAVRSAFQRVAAQAGPDDLFLFFFSGHGSQSEESNLSGEADLRDETIVLRDGEISDDEVAQWFSQVNARVGIIALDACFSGGFARDVVTRPGIMGLFSSEEDLTSSVADKFQAGGYLSHFLRTGFGGEADENGDLAITAGELSTYLWRKFAAEVENEEAYTSERQRNYQRLVVDRGGVKIDDLVLALN